MNLNQFQGLLSFILQIISELWLKTSILLHRYCISESDLKRRKLWYKIFTQYSIYTVYHVYSIYTILSEKAMAPHSSTLAWKIPWMEEPGRLQSMGSLLVGHDWATSLSLFTFLHWRRTWQPIPVLLPGESQGRGLPCRLPSMGSHRVGHDWSDLAAAAYHIIHLFFVLTLLSTFPTTM